MSTKEKKNIQESEKGKDVEVARPMPAVTPYEEMERLFNRWFEGISPRRLMRPLRMDWPTWSEMTAPLEARLPKVDVIERDEEVVVRAEVPGVEKNDLDISVSDNTVTIKGQTKREEKEEKGDYYRCEISQGSFSRTIPLPQFVNSEAAKATFKDGVLELTLPKLEKTRRRNVKID